MEKIIINEKDKLKDIDSKITFQEKAALQG